MRLLRSIHAWAGAALCLIIALLGVTGSLLVFEEDYLRLTMAEAREAPRLDAASLGALTEAVEDAFGEEAQTLVFARPGVGVHRVYLADNRHAYVDNDGAPAAVWQGSSRPEALMFDLHHELLLGEFGHLTVGIMGLAGTLFGVTGLIIWAPFARTLGARVWPRTMRRRDIVSAHRNLGVICAAPLIVLSLTGAAMIFHAETRVLLRALFSDEIVEAAPPPAVAAGDVDWTLAIPRAQAAFPDAAPRIVSFSSGPDDPPGMRLQQPGEWHPNGRTTVTIDPAANEVVASFNAMGADRGLRIANAVYPIHAAFVGGRIYDAISALTGVAMAVLGLFGAFSFLRVKLRPRSHARHRAA